LDGLILDKNPLLMEDDIERYQLPRHILRLKPGVVERLTAEIDAPVWGTPFVVVADGRRIFLGAFWTHLSSYLADVPTISLARLQSRLPGNDPNLLPKNAIRLGRAGLVRQEGGKTWRSPQQDERTDARLLQALQKRQKLSDLRSLDESQWGKAVEGVQCRLRPEKSTWKVGETPQIQADFRNRGERMGNRSHPGEQ
jgi:hypothetical protein